MASLVRFVRDKQNLGVLFSSTAIALYGYDQGLMSLVNTNHDYLSTMGISAQDTLVGIIVSVYYLGCATGAVIGSALADRLGRKRSILLSILTASVGNLICFVAGLGFSRGSMATMFMGRVVMGLGVGGIDAVVPTYSAELTDDDARGKALGIQFQFNILGLNIAFALNLAMTRVLGKYNQWAWRTPIVAMNAFSVILILIIGRLPESPRYYVSKNRIDDAKRSLKKLIDEDSEVEKKLEAMCEAAKNEGSNKVTYTEMMFQPDSKHFHPTMIVIMGQVNQALTGYGFVSVYGSQCVELLGFGVNEAENLIMANYVAYLLLMTFAWLLIDAVGRRILLLVNSMGLILFFFLLGIMGALVWHAQELGESPRSFGIPGVVFLFIATGNFGIGWLVPPWLIPTEIYETRARAKGTAISVIIWGLANFAITLLSPVLFNNLDYIIFFVFALTNLAAGLWTWRFLPESGGRSFEENLVFFDEAKSKGTWAVQKVNGGSFLHMLYGREHERGEGENTPLLRRVGQQVTGPP